MMKLLNKLWGAGLLAILLITAVPQISAAQDDYISEQEFYDELEPYGTWVYDQQYGNVWVPDVEEDFQPYATRGHWVLTEYGNTWVSDYPWGWATFHYGRWTFDDYYGWMWVPGYEWAPAWVNWREGGGYYGWAPLTPGISIDLAFGNSYNVPDFYWAFAPTRYINSPSIYNYYIPRTRVVNVINRTTIINNTYVRDNRRYIGGPRIADIQRYTRQKPQVYAINNARRPGTVNVQNNTVNIFRPTIRQNNNARPTRVVNGAAYRQQNPNESIARRGNGTYYNRDNAEKLKDVARNANSNNGVVRVNDRRNGDRDQLNRRPTMREQGVDPGSRTGMRENRPNVDPPTQQNRELSRDEQKAEQLRRRGITPAQDETQEEAWRRRQTDASMRQATRDGFNREQRVDAQRIREEQREKQRQERAQQQQQQRRPQEDQQQVIQQQQQQQPTDQRRQQQDQWRAQRDEQRRQQQGQQRQQFDQQRQQQQSEQRRQQQEQQRQQVDQQRQQQQAQQNEQRRQQQEQQRAQQAEQRRQQQEQQRQQADQQRQQQQAQQAEQRRQQQDQQRQQQQAQRDQQRQQQQQGQQQREQMQQQRPQQQQQQGGEQRQPRGRRPF